MFRASNGIIARILSTEEALQIFHAHETSRVGSPAKGFTVWPVGELGRIIACAWTRVEPLYAIPAGLLDELES